jgi:uncharacterized protein (TIGR02145 family)
MNKKLFFKVLLILFSIGISIISYSSYEGQREPEDKCKGAKYNPQTQFCFEGNVSNKGEFTDARDGKKYKTTKIGEQVWMAENLNYNASGSKCYDNKVSNCEKYGRLYNWATAMSVCPSGWHIPSNEDWDKLMRYVDGSTDTSSPYDSYTAGRYLKATSGWSSCGPSDSGNSYLCEDTHGFSALPGGYGDSDGSFYVVGYRGYWWSASEYYSNYVYDRYMHYASEDAYYNYDNKSYLYSVRCVED